MVDRFDLSGKRALITGGGRGLGREMAQAFAEQGADVIIASRKLDVLEQTAAEITEATGRTITAKACHVGEWEQVSAWRTRSTPSSAGSTFWSTTPV